MSAVSFTFHFISNLTRSITSSYPCFCLHFYLHVSCHVLSLSFTSFPRYLFMPLPSRSFVWLDVLGFPIFHYTANPCICRKYLCPFISFQFPFILGLRHHQLAGRDGSLRDTLLRKCRVQLQRVEALRHAGVFALLCGNPFTGARSILSRRQYAAAPCVELRSRPFSSD